MIAANPARLRPDGLQRGSLPFLHSAALHVKKFGLANLKPCQASVLSPKERRLVLETNEKSRTVLISGLVSAEEMAF